jgi:3-oxoacyl-[acyl-carrier protein] reductase
VVATSHARPVDVEDDGIVRADLDLSSEESIEHFVSTWIAPNAGVEIVIFLSGVLPGKALADYDDAEIDHVVAVNFSGQVKLLRRLLPFLAAPSHVLMMSSVSAERGSFDPVYSASKAALLGLVKALATGLAPKVRVNAIAPGLIEGTTMFHDMSSERKASHISTNPLKRLLSTEELAAIVHDLTRPHWSHLNGACIDVNGGSYVR